MGCKEVHVWDLRNHHAANVMKNEYFGLVALAVSTTPNLTPNLGTQHIGMDFSFQGFNYHMEMNEI